MNTDEAKRKYAIAESATDRFLLRLVASPFTAAILAVIAVLIMILVVVW